MPSPSNTTLLDNFNSYVDGNLGGTGDVTGGAWAPLDPASTPMVVISHQVGVNVTVAQSAWMAASYGSDYDIIIDVPVAGTGRVALYGSWDRTSLNGYGFVYYGTTLGGPIYAIVRFDADTPTTLASVSGHTLVNTDKLWASKRGTTLSLYWGTSGGVYTLGASFADATYSTGLIGMQFSDDSSERADNFSGGTVSSATVATVATLGQFTKDVVANLTNFDTSMSLRYGAYDDDFVTRFNGIVETATATNIYSVPLGVFDRKVLMGMFSA